MKVLIVGSGGREHAIATSVAKSSKVDKIYCAPGNAGIGQIAECVNIGAMEFDKLVDFAKENEITVAKALDIFYHSQLYELMSNGVSDMHCMSDEYLVHELINEQKEVNG